MFSVVISSFAWIFAALLKTVSGICLAALELDYQEVFSEFSKLSGGVH